MGINIKKLTLLRCIQSFWVILILICAALPSRTGARLLRATSEDDTAGQKTYRTIIQKTTPSGVTPDEDVTDGPKTDKSTEENTKLSGVSQGSTMSRTGRKVELQLQRHDPLGLGSYHIFKLVAPKIQHRRLLVKLPPYQAPAGPPTESKPNERHNRPPPGGPRTESTLEP